jgi:hypothetical protein
MHIGLIRKGVTAQEARFMSRVLRLLARIRKQLTPSILSKAIADNIKSKPIFILSAQLPQTRNCKPVLQRCCQTTRLWKLMPKVVAICQCLRLSSPCLVECGLLRCCSRFRGAGSRVVHLHTRCCLSNRQQTPRPGAPASDNCSIIIRR